MLVSKTPLCFSAYWLPHYKHCCWPCLLEGNTKSSAASLIHWRGQWHNIIGTSNKMWTYFGSRRWVRENGI